MHADKPAFCDENRVFTFGELLKAAQGLGTHLAKTVDTLHKPVAVLIGRTAESVAAMQGVLYAGAATFRLTTTCRKRVSAVFSSRSILLPSSTPRQPQTGRAACRLCAAHLDGRGLCSTG